MKKKIIGSVRVVNGTSVIVERIKNGVNGNPRYSCLVIKGDLVYKVIVTTYGGELEACEMACKEVGE